VFDIFEIIIIDDGSNDNSPKIIDNLVRENKEVKAVHHLSTLGAGKGFLSGLENSSCEFIMGLPADDAYTASSLISLFQAVGQADLIIGRRRNQKITRTKLRYFLSRLITSFTSMLFHLNFYDYNGLIVSPVKKVRKFNIKSRHFALGHEIVVRAIRDWKLNYLEVDVEMNRQDKTFTTAIKMSSLLDVFVTFSYLLVTRNSPTKSNSL
jgi:glycosyltransferase involved in cell wall biosynthesis